MSKSAKNLIVVLGIITTVFAAYYFFTQEAALVLRSSESNRQLDQLLFAADEFTARQQVLNNITLDTTLFESDVFTSLRSFSTEPSEYIIGRPDPFLSTALDPGTNAPTSDE